MTITAEVINQEQLNALCVALRQGSSVRGYLDKTDAGFSRSTLYAWLEQHATDEQKDQYASALESSADSDMDDIRNIAETLTMQSSADRAQIARVQIDALKWIASKKKPKVYGDSTTVRGDKENPLVPAVFTLNLGSPGNSGDENATD